MGRHSKGQVAAGAREFTIAYPPHPTTGLREPNAKQALAHVCPADILFYGGVRGGGKTQFLAVDGVSHCVQNPGMLAFIFRRTRDELKFNVLKVLLELLPPEVAEWSRSDHCFKFFNDAMLVLDFLEHEDDIGRYLGAEAGWIGVDQAEQMTEWTVMQMVSLIRSTKPWPKKMRLTANPGLGVGVAWIKRWFIKPTAEELGARRPPRPMEMWRPYPRRNDPTPPAHMPTRCFIPANFSDNDALKTADPTYLARIYTAFAGRPEIARAQAEGDWDASDATIVGKRWAESKTVRESDTALLDFGCHVGQTIPWNVIHNDRWKPPAGSPIFGSVDYGYGDPWSFHLHCTLPGGHSRTWYEEYATGVVDSEQARRIGRALTSLTYADGSPILGGLEWIVYDPQMRGSRMEMGLAKSIIETYGDVLPSGVPLLQGAGGRSARISRPNRWLDALATAPDGWPWWSVTTACPDLIRTVPEVPWDPDDKQVEAGNSENHCIAAGTLIATRRGDVPIEDVRTSDDVLTRAGYRRVVWAARTGVNAPVITVVSRQGHQLTCTTRHLVWTTGGWIEAAKLLPDAVLWSCRPPSRSGAASATTSKGRISRGIAARAQSLVWAVYTVTCGRTCVDPFPTAATSITATATARTSRFIARTLRRLSGQRAAGMLQSPRPHGSADVYDLTIEGPHEFFANGLLVHNCYEDVGRFFEARPHAPSTPPPDPYAHLDSVSRAHHEALDKAVARNEGGSLAGFAW